jgi:hypothetical protein
LTLRLAARSELIASTLQHCEQNGATIREGQDRENHRDFDPASGRLHGDSRQERQKLKFFLYTIHLKMDSSQQTLVIRCRLADREPSQRSDCTAAASKTGPSA